jgi:hypothetical protein
MVNMVNRMVNFKISVIFVVIYSKSNLYKL